MATEPEDIAYSLFVILNVYLPVICRECTWTSSHRDRNAVRGHFGLVVGWGGIYVQ